MKRLLVLLALLPIFRQAQIINVRSTAAPASVPVASLSASQTTLICTSVAGSQGLSQQTKSTGSTLGTNPVTVPAPTGYLVSLNNSSFATSQTINPSSGSVDQFVYFALASTNTPGAINGTSTVTCTGAGVAPVTITLNGLVTSGPSLSVSPTLLTLNGSAGAAGTIANAAVSFGSLS